MVEGTNKGALADRDYDYKTTSSEPFPKGLL